jgi:hypothetical protein
MAAGNTYEAIATNTISGSSTNSVTFSSIPSTYTDLLVVFQGTKISAGGQSLIFNLNGDTGSNYSFTYLGGNGSTASSGRVSNSTYAALGAWVANLSTTGESDFLHLMNYSNTTTYKTTLARSSAASSATEASVALWRSTAAINSITLTVGSPAAFTAGSTFSLYGIKAA